MKEIKITEEIALQMKESGIESLVELSKANYPELFEQKWDRGAKNKEGYYKLNRDTDKGFFVSYDKLIGSKKSHTYPTEELAEKECKMFSLMQEMRAYTRWANEQDDFVPDWKDDIQFKNCIIMRNINGVVNTSTECIQRYMSGIFHCYFKTEERAKECLGIFEKDIKEVFKL